MVRSLGSLLIEQHWTYCVLIDLAMVLPNLSSFYIKNLGPVNRSALWKSMIYVLTKSGDDWSANQLVNTYCLLVGQASVPSYWSNFNIQYLSFKSKSDKRRSMLSLSTSQHQHIVITVRIRSVHSFSCRKTQNACIFLSCGKKVSGQIRTLL